MKWTIFLLLLVSVPVFAQMFIPFSFWQNANTPLAISPTLVYLLPGDPYTFTASGGNGTYSWAQTIAASNDGSTMDASANITMDYTARLTSYQTDVITLTSNSVSVSASVVTYDALNISPTTLTIAVNGTQSFTATGGCLNGTNCVGGSRVFSVTGVGSINSSSGFYTAPATSGTALVQVSDSIGNVATANVTVVSGLTIVPATLNLPVYSTNTFSAIAGSTPYTYSIFSGSGSIVSNTGVYTAASSTGSAVVRVRDNINNTSDSSVTIIKPVDIKVGQYFTCALYNEGSVKCWGNNGNGQLGIGSTAAVGDATTEVGGANQFVDLGTGRTASSIAVGYAHACALLNNSTIKCWGMGTYGQLGQGNVNSIGDAANEMGDNLASISLGTGRTATSVYAYGYTTCAKLDNNTSKCWGRNTGGMLGQGDTNNRGDGANEMGDNLSAIDFGTSRTATKIDGGLDFSCALLDNSTVKCWGANAKGQLGKDNQVNLGDGANEMGNNLTAISLGAGRTASDISCGNQHTCVKRDNNSAICWGRNSDGQAGIGNNNGQNKDVGDAAGDMAAIAGGISWGSGFGTLSQIWAAGNSSCAMDTSNVVKCWGKNTEGQLLLGSTTSQDAPNNTASSLGTGLVVSKLNGAYFTLCALFTNDRIKCWGRSTNASGVATGMFLLGNSTNHLGDVAGELGNSLPYLNH